MNNTATRRGIADDEFDIILGVCWEQIALFAFEQYKEKGRGAVSLDRHGLEEDIQRDQVDLGYSIYEPGFPDPHVALMIKEYDPSWEIVFQYLRPDGEVRTARIRTGPDNRHPWRIYLFDHLLQDSDVEEEPEAGNN